MLWQRAGRGAFREKFLRKREKEGRPTGGPLYFKRYQNLLLSFSVLKPPSKPIIRPPASA